MTTPIACFLIFGMFIGLKWGSKKEITANVPDVVAGLCLLAAVGLSMVHLIGLLFAW
jgi:hypothetical protein